MALNIFVASILHSLSTVSLVPLLLQKKLTEEDKHTNLLSLMFQEVKNYAIFTIDPEGTIMSWNPGARYLLGYQGREIIGKPLSILFPTTNKSTHLHKDLVKALEYGQYEHVTAIIKKNKQKIFVKCLVTALWGHDKKLKGFSKMVQDITPQIEAERLREEFISLAGHELKNPITSIKAYLQLLEMKFKKKNETEYGTLISKTISQIDKLTYLLRDILDVSRIAVGTLPYRDKESVPIDELLQDIIENIKLSNPSRRLVMEKITHTTINNIDKARLEQVFVNLFNNAIKYSPEKRDIVIAMRKSKNHVTISIKDNGIGIPKKDQKIIFDKFYRSDNAKKIQQGLGLGLHLAQEIVYHYKGEIWVESTKGRGSTFSVSLPLKGSA